MTDVHEYVGTDTIFPYGHTHRQQHTISKTGAERLSHDQQDRSRDVITRSARQEQRGYPDYLSSTRSARQEQRGYPDYLTQSARQEQRGYPDYLSFLEIVELFQKFSRYTYIYRRRSMEQEA